MENLTLDQIKEKATEITKLLVEKLREFTNETGCVITGVDVTTSEEQLGQTELTRYKQTVQTYYSIPPGHPATGTK